MPNHDSLYHRLFDHPGMVADDLDLAGMPPDGKLLPILPVPSSTTETAAGRLRHVKEGAALSLHDLVGLPGDSPLWQRQSHPCRRWN